jgi:HEAT repeat protein
MVAGRVGLGQLEPELRTRADDPSPFVRAAVIYALVANGLEADPTPLATMLITDPSPRVRAHAAFILGELGDRSALPMLRQAANADIARADASAVRVMRLQFAEAMAKLGDETPLQGLRAALYPSRPEDLELTALAVQIIGGLGDRGSIAQLIYLSAARNEGRYMPPEVRLSVGQALGRMGRTEGAFLADEYRVHPMPAVREQAAHVYGWTLAESELGKLTPMLEDQAPQVRLGAAAAVLRVLDRDRP